MAITADHIRTTLTAYLDAHPDEKPRLEPVLALLDQDADLTSRKEFRGHATAGAVLTNPVGKVLFIEHKALSRWLLPGGHLEPEDTTLISAALRELVEETGIATAHVVSLADTPVHIDVHTIPRSDAKNEDEHQHIDFRYLFTTSTEHTELQAEEVTDAAWRGTDSIADPQLRTRVTAAMR